MKKIEIQNIETCVGKVKLIILKSERLEVVLSSYGAGIYQMTYDGAHMVTSPEKLDDYLVSTAYYGKTIGRHSGRLFGPNYMINDTSYPVITDDAEMSQLHGGKQGLSFQHFYLKGYERMNDMINVTLHADIPAYSDGFPGNLHVDVTYEITKDDVLKINYRAQSSDDTLCHLTNHVYFNLGINKNDVTDHTLYVNSDQYIDVDQTYRMKKINHVVGTPFDFRLPTHIGSRIHEVKQPDIIGYDHCFLLNKHDLEQKIITLSHDETNIGIDVFTNYPSVVLYTHNHPAPARLDGVITNGVHSSIAIECQYPPDSIHHDMLNSGILKQGDIEDKVIMIKPYKKNEKR